MTVSLWYFDGCPNWRSTDRRLRRALAEVGLPDVPVEHHVIRSFEQAATAGIAGSPTVLVDGRDPFADQAGPPGLSCRLYRTEKGLAGAPTRRQLVEALRTVIGNGRSTRSSTSRSGSCAVTT